ncbi:MAG: SurA N-terminal domain-containing protein [Kiritimatiellia bacterium]
MLLLVNGETVAPMEVEREYRRLEALWRERGAPEALDAQRPALMRQALDHAIGRRLLLQEARRQDLKVSEVELKAVLRQLGETESVTEDVRRRLEEALLVEKIVQALTAKVAEPGAEEVSFFRAQHPEFFSGTQALETERSDATVRYLHAQKRNQALDAFVAQLRRAALIETAAVPAAEDAAPASD